MPARNINRRFEMSKTEIAFAIKTEAGEYVSDLCGTAGKFTEAKLFATKDAAEFEMCKNEGEKVVEVQIREVINK